jgi:hypothetical protein
MMHTQTRTYWLWQARSHTVLPAYLDAFGSDGRGDGGANELQLVTDFETRPIGGAAAGGSGGGGGGGGGGGASPVWVPTAGGSLWGADKRARTAHTGQC